MAFFRKRASKDDGDLDRFLDDYDVPSFPGAINDVLGKLREDEASNADIAQNLEADPGMSVRILRLVNSSSFGLRQKVEDLGQAVNLIGRSSLESILISLAVREVMPSQSHPDFDPISFWRASSQRAAIAGRLAAKLSPADRSFCWTSAMLQDIAVPLLVAALGDRYCAILRTASESEDPLHVLELDGIGFDHADLGRRLCEKWALPERLEVSIAEHHQPPTAETLPFRLVAQIRTGERDSQAEPAGVAEMIETAASLGFDPEVCAAQIQAGLADAADLAAMP